MNNTTQHSATTAQPLLVSADEAATLVQVSRSTWMKLKASGGLPKPVRLARRVLWRVDELKAWVNAGCPPHSRWQQIAKSRWT